MIRINLLLAVLAIAFMIIGCGGDQEASSEHDEILNVVTTTGMIADAVRNVGGEYVKVTALMGPGVDPHLYKASEGDVSRMTGADLIFYNGLHLEGAMTEILKKMTGRTKTFAVSDRVESSKLLSSEDYPGLNDPHIWFDVSMWKNAVEAIRDELAKADPENAESYMQNAEKYLAQLDSLHSYVLEQSRRVPEQQRVLITAHDAFNYFGRAYGFKVRGLQGISTASEAGTADVQNLSDFVAENRIPAVFIESSVPVRNIEAVQAAVKARGFNVQIGGELFSDAMGSPGTPEDNYIGMVRHNIDTIVSALLEEAERSE